MKVINVEIKARCNRQDKIREILRTRTADYRGEDHQEDTYFKSYGSRKHMMLELLKNESRAFYRFGDLFIMDKIPEKHWVDFITRRFRKTGKKISEEQVKLMVQMTNNHPDYLQQLCHNTWNGSNSETRNQTIHEAMSLVVNSNSTN